MDIQEAKAVLESILFVADEPVSIARLANTLQVERSLIREAARVLTEEYADRGLRVQYQDELVQIVTAPDLAEND